MYSTYWVTPNFLCGRCGPRQAPWDLTTFRKAGIRNIISLVDVGLSPVETGAQGIVLHECFLPMSALATRQERVATLKRLQPILQAIQLAHQQNEGVLAHCAMGIDRTGLVLACALVLTEKITAKAAIERIHQANPRALQLPGYQAAISDFVDLWDPPTGRLKLPEYTKGLTSFIRADERDG